VEVAVMVVAVTVVSVMAEADEALAKADEERAKVAWATVAKEKAEEEVWIQEKIRVEEA